MGGKCDALVILIETIKHNTLPAMPRKSQGQRLGPAKANGFFPCCSLFALLYANSGATDDSQWAPLIYDVQFPSRTVHPGQEDRDQVEETRGIFLRTKIGDYITCVNIHWPRLRHMTISPCKKGWVLWFSSETFACPLLVLHFWCHFEGCWVFSKWVSAGGTRSLRKSLYTLD